MEVRIVRECEAANESSHTHTHTHVRSFRMRVAHQLAHRELFRENIINFPLKSLIAKYFYRNISIGRCYWGERFSESWTCGIFAKKSLESSSSRASVERAPNGRFAYRSHESARDEDRRNASGSSRAGRWLIAQTKRRPRPPHMARSITHKQNNAYNRDSPAHRLLLQKVGV